MPSSELAVGVLVCQKDLFVLLGRSSSFSFCPSICLPLSFISRLYLLYRFLSPLSFLSIFLYISVPDGRLGTTCEATLKSCSVLFPSRSLFSLSTLGHVFYLFSLRTLAPWQSNSCPSRAELLTSRYFHNIKVSRHLSHPRNDDARCCSDLRSLTFSQPSRILLYFLCSSPPCPRNA